MVFTVHIILWKTEGILSFGILVEENWSLLIELHDIMLLGFWQHDIIPPMEQNLSLEYPIKIKKFNDTIHISFVKHDIYQKVNYLHNQDICPHPTHIAQIFEKLNTLITPLIFAVDKNAERK